MRPATILRTATSGLLAAGLAATVAATAIAHTPPVVTDLEWGIGVPDTSGPEWDDAEVIRFPGCVALDDKGDWIPSRIIVEARDGAAQSLPYSDATIARIDASWDNVDGRDDLHTIGACR